MEVMQDYTNNEENHVIINQAVKERLNNHVKKRLQDSEDLNPDDKLKCIKKPKKKNKKVINEEPSSGTSTSTECTNKTENYEINEITPPVTNPAVTFNNGRFEPPVNNNIVEENSMFDHSLLSEILNAKKMLLLQNPDKVLEHPVIMDPMFLPFSTSNGVPQESKLATYMQNRQSTSTPVGVVNNLNQNFSKINLGSPIAVKKGIPSSPEFVPTNRNANVSSSPNVFNSFSGLGGPGGYTRNCVESPQSVTCSPRLTPQSSPPPNALNNSSPTFEKNNSATTTYQENVGGTTYFYSTSSGDNLSLSTTGNMTAGTTGIAGTTTYQVYPGTPSHLSTLKSKNTSSPFFVSEDIRNEILNKNALTLTQSDPVQFSDLPNEVDNYHDLCPLESIPSGPMHKAQLLGYPTSTYKATNIKTGVRYCLRRIHGFRLQNTKCMVFVDMWKRLYHSNVVQLREVFTTKAFGDNSMVFVYDYHPGSETLLSKHFLATETLNGYSDPFSSDTNAPRPYSHTKNTILRHQQNNKLPEPVIWNYVIQLTSALRVIHAAGLACRTLDPTKIILTGRSRLRLSCLAITDVLTFDTNATNPLALIPHYQQEDLNALGKLVLALACKSLMAIQRENITSSLELVSRIYTSDLRNLIMYLLSTQQRRTVTDLMPMIGARFYTQLDALQLRTDLMENEISKEMENGRLFRLLVKLGTINERPELNLDGTWAETGDRYMLKLFRDYVFHQVTEDGRPWLDMSHVVQCLNKLDAGVPEKVCLMSRDEQSILVVSYAELKHCLEQSFDEIVATANGGTSCEPLT